MNDFLGIRGGRILDPGRGVDVEGDVLIREGRIAAVGPDVAAEAERVIDARGLIVCPGLVDIHCHLREPGHEHKETIETGTHAAARGGFTTVLSPRQVLPPSSEMNARGTPFPVQVFRVPSGAGCNAAGMSKRPSFSCTMRSLLTTWYPSWDIVHTLSLQDWASFPEVRM